MAATDTDELAKRLDELTLNPFIKREIELDSDTNPYLETPKLLTDNDELPKDKIVLYLGHHRLQDENGIYPDFMLPCTKLWAYSADCAKTPNATMEQKLLFRVPTTKPNREEEEEKDVDVKAKSADEDKTKKPPSHIQQGSTLHRYLECRLRDSMSAEYCKEHIILSEAKEYAQLEDFISHHKDCKFKCEFYLVSFRHKIVGKVDAIETLEGGEILLYEWKRTNSEQCKQVLKGKSISDGRIVRVNLDALSPSHDFVQHALQLATYRKMLILNGYKNVLKRAFVIVFHPERKTWCKVELDLTHQLNFAKSICVMNAAAQFHGEGKFGRISIINFVEVVFKNREDQLKQYFELRN